MITTNNRKTFEEYKKVYDSNGLIDIVGVTYMIKEIRVEEYSSYFSALVPNRFQATIHLEEVVKL